MSNILDLAKIISGGQTGVDRAALDIAIEFKIPHGGWCPSGCRAEDGRIDSHYNLEATAEPDYLTRTRLNVRDADGTLIINSGKLEGGTATTIQFAKQLNKPVFLIDADEIQDIYSIKDWLTANNIKVLNIAGPRESKRPGIYKKSSELLRMLFNCQTTASVQAR